MRTNQHPLHHAILSLSKTQQNYALSNQFDKHGSTDSRKLQRLAKQILSGLSIAFDKTATWVWKLSWWKFSCLQFYFYFRGHHSGSVFTKRNHRCQIQIEQTKTKDASFSAENGKQIIKTDDANLEIDSTGIRIRSPKILPLAAASKSTLMALM